MTLFCIFCFFAKLPGQSTAPLLPHDVFEVLLNQYSLELDSTVFGSYKELRYSNSTYLTSQYALFSKKERMEIRICITPLDTNNVMSFLPHLKATTLVTHLAANEENSIIAAHEVSAQVANDKYGADWARILYFPPKSGFSEFRHCRMLALFKENRVMAYVFFLFDQPSPILDNRLDVLRFFEL